MQILIGNHLTEHEDTSERARGRTEGAEGGCIPIGRAISTNWTTPCSKRLNHQPKSFLAISGLMMLASMIILFSAHSLTALYVGIALVGYGNSNVFSIVFSQALFYAPNEKNEVSGLMIMGLFGGTVFPLAMGYAADAIGQLGAVAVMTAGVIYILCYTIKIKKEA